LSTLTKILVVLQLVFSLVVAVVLVFGTAHLENYRAEVDAAHMQTVAAQASLAKSQNDVAVANAQVADANSRLTSATDELKKQNNDLATKLAQVSSERGALEARNAQQQSSISQLTSSLDSDAKLIAAKDTELSQLRPENVSLVQKNAELNRVNNDQSTSNRLAEQAIRKLQEQLATTETGGKSGATGPGASSDMGVASLSASPANAQINAKISSIAPSAGHTLIEVPLGTRDGVKVNTALRIYRNSGYVGDAVVQSVFADSSVARVTIVKPGDTIKVGDLVMTPAAQ
jgi:vacuolar-type H+-ATPase subunit I/STV1